MALVVGANSYISVADADTYFADRPYATDWDNADDADKVKSLIMATTKIDMRDFKGQRVSSNQVLAFPRTRLPLVDGVDYDSEVYPQPILNAVCEEALIVLGENPTNTPSEAQYKRVKSGSGNEVEYRDATVSFKRSLVNGYLKGFELYGNGSVSHG